MPTIIFEGGKLDKDKKEELIRELTESSVKVTGIEPGAFVVFIHENEYDNIGVGGETLTRRFADKD